VTTAPNRLVPRQTYASPLSYSGSVRRLFAWTRKPGWWRRPLGWTAIVLAVLLVSLYYLTIFGLLFWFVIPFRFFRRHQRKSLAVQQAQLEEMRRLSVGPPSAY
jgi:hypothetical protein